MFTGLLHIPSQVETSPQTFGAASSEAKTELGERTLLEPVLHTLLRCNHSSCKMLCLLLGTVALLGPTASRLGYRSALMETRSGQRLGRTADDAICDRGSQTQARSAVIMRSPKDRDGRYGSHYRIS